MHKNLMAVIPEVQEKDGLGTVVLIKEDKFYSFNPLVFTCPPSRVHIPTQCGTRDCCQEYIGLSTTPFLALSSLKWLMSLTVNR